MKQHSIFFIVALLILTACGSSSNNTTSSSQDTLTNDTSNATNTSQTVIDVLVLYDNNVKNAYSSVSTRVHHLFAVSNTIYQESGLSISINPKQILFYDAETYPALEEIAESSEVKSLRETYKADTVLIYQMNPENEVGLCGTAYSALAYEYTFQFKEAMYAQVAINCPADSTAHEIGHNMGLSHSHKQDGDDVLPYSYGLGHGVDGLFSTMMAYPFVFETNRLIMLFSSPEYECLPGYPCGIPIGEPGEAHATKVMEVTAPKIAAIYED